MNIRYLKHVLLFVLLLLTSCWKSEPVPTIVISPLADSLSTEFLNLKSLIDNYETDSFLKKIDPYESLKLKKSAQIARIQDKLNYIRQNFSHLPDLDTLLFNELRDTKNYIRLTYIGKAKRYYKQSEKIVYTFIIFRNCDESWKFTAISSIEKEKYDFYGHELSFHETELPPLFRFPKISL